MPQMMPINWILSFITFIMIFYMFNIMNYYNYNIKIPSFNQTKSSLKLKKMFWKW